MSNEKNDSCSIENLKTYNYSNIVKTLREDMGLGKRENIVGALLFIAGIVLGLVPICKRIISVSKIVEIIIYIIILVLVVFYIIYEKLFNNIDLEKAINNLSEENLSFIKNKDILNELLMYLNRSEDAFINIVIIFITILGPVQGLLSNFTDHLNFENTISFAVSTFGLFMISFRLLSNSKSNIVVKQVLQHHKIKSFKNNNFNKHYKLNINYLHRVVYF